MMQTFLPIVCLLKKKNSPNREKVQQCTHQRQMTTVLSHRFHVLFIIQMTQASAPAGFTDRAFWKLFQQLGICWYHLLKQNMYLVSQ